MRGDVLGDVGAWYSFRDDKRALAVGIIDSCTSFHLPPLGRKPMG